MSEECKSYRPNPNTMSTAYNNRTVVDKHRISNCTDKIKLNGSSLQSVSKDDNNVGQIYFPTKFLV